MQSRNYVFTINNPTGLLDCTEWKHCKYCIYQEEVGDNGTHHFQGYAEFTQPIRLRALKNLEPSAHWEIRKGSKAQATAYCSKEETRVGGPYIFGTDKTNQGQRTDLESFRDAIRLGISDNLLITDYLPIMAKYPRLASTIRRANIDSNIESNILENFKPWQQLCLDIINTTTHPRKIHWWYDEEGNSGKTAIAKHIRSTQSCFYSNGGKHSDITYAYEGEKIVIFDFPRTSQEFVCYSVIETIKNGILTVSKYESRTLTFPVPQVHIFANFEPDKSKLSLDRWDVHHIINKL